MEQKEEVAGNDDQLPLSLMIETTQSYQNGTQYADIRNVPR